jgi:hypothetical protein
LIDWYALSTSVVWILGLSELLATISYAYWLGHVQDKTLRQVLSSATFRLATSGGIALFALGMLLTVESGWERIGWSVVMLLLLWDSVSEWKNRSDK